MLQCCVIFGFRSLKTLRWSGSSRVKGQGQLGLRISGKRTLGVSWFAILGQRWRDIVWPSYWAGQREPDGWMDYRLSCFYHFFQQIFCLGLKNTLVALLLLVCRRQSRFLAHRRCFAIFGWLWCAEGGIEDGSACILMLHKILLEISLLIYSQLCPLIHKIASEDFPFFHLLSANWWIVFTSLKVFNHGWVCQLASSYPQAKRRHFK